MSDAEQQPTVGGEAGDDPVAEFLAREQDQFAELGENFDTVIGTSAGNGFGSEFDADPVYANIPTVSNENSDFNAADQFEGGNSDMFGGGGFDDQYGAVKAVDRQRAEPEKIRIWREEQAERLAKKDAESEKKKAEWREIARHELEDWYKHRDEQVEKAKLLNRESENAFVSERDEKKAGGEWERICRQCDFNPKSTPRNSKDVSRMRSILLQLKQTPLAGRQ
jgi:clathrin light chain A